MQRGPEVFSKSNRIVNRRTVLGAIGGGVVAAALGDRLWPLVRDSRAQGSHTVDMSRFGANVGGKPGFGTLGDYVFLSPTKLGGGAHAQDLLTGKTLAWIEYWNYGDPCRSRTISRPTRRPIRARASSSSIPPRAAPTC